MALYYPLCDLAGRVLFLYNFAMNERIKYLEEIGICEQTIAEIDSIQDDEVMEEQMRILRMWDDRHEYVD